MARFTAACLAVSMSNSVAAVHSDHGGYVHRHVNVEVSGNGETSLLSDGLLEMKAGYDYGYEYLGASEDYDYGLGETGSKGANGSKGGGGAAKGDYKPKSVADAWANHLAGFVDKDITKIMLDYTNTSVLKAFDFTTKKLVSAKGTKQIEDFFVELLCTMNIDTKTEGAVELPLTSAGAGLLEMMAMDDQYEDDYDSLGAYDTYDYESDSLGASSYEYNYGDYGLGANAEPASEKKGAGNKTRPKGKGSGPGKVKEAGVAKGGGAANKGPAEVTEKPRQVYLIWACPKSGIVSATDTFIFDPKFKIARQNIAYTLDPTKSTKDSADKGKCPM